MKPIQIHEIEGFQIGQQQDTEAGTGVTCILCLEGATGAVDVRGGGPATRETDLLDPKNMVQKINGVVLSGGSAFGLESSSGVMEYLRQKGAGFGMKEFCVPIVCQASLFDLGCGKPDVYPDKAMGYQAAENSEAGNFQSGCYGAGTGASVGKMLGFDKAMKSGIGSYAMEIGPLQVGAIVAVNACGDVYEPDSKERLAGVYDQTTGTAYDTEEIVLQMAAQQLEGMNTTIGCILTNADLDQAQLTKVAGMAQNGFARTIRPVHTPNDGDTLFAMTTNKVPADVTLVGVMAVQCVAKAIVDAVKSAKASYGLASWSSLHENQ
ncbi:P1 family peptidase [Erysipelotrichaceae bacterium RD49]|nr:P1 family peptidase [Erysipelotrichaceae bacterium RD49]